jgi:thiamine monophosphate synthase
VFPIGGIDEQGAAALIEAGTRRLAVGAGILTRRDPAGAARRLASMVGAV